MSDLIPKLRYSRFRHVFAKSIRRSEWYDTGPGRGLAVAANPKMIALAIDVPAGGVVQVAKLSSMGRGHMELGKIKDHEGLICDLKWNPFNDNVLATSSNDTTVRIWHIDDMLRIRCLRVLRSHSRRVQFIEWHSTVDNAVFSLSNDGRVILWNIETDETVFVVDECNAFSLALNYDCSEFAITTKSRKISVLDARTGKKKRETTLVHDGAMPSRVVYSTLSSVEYLVTTGNTRNTRRQVAIYKSDPLNAPLTVLDLDGGSGLLMPIIDNDLSLLYIAGKGDANIRFYELNDEAPYILYLSESSGTRAHTAVCSLPKRGLNVSQCEIMRIFRVDAQQLIIEPLSFIVPRRGDGFQSDLFPLTRSPTPSLTFREWFAGLCREPIMFELKDCILNCTNKPVAFAKESSNRIKLMIGDANNDRKFRFLSQVTKPDYREIYDREDYEELLKLECIKSRIAAEEALKESSKCNGEDGQQAGSNNVRIGNKSEHQNSLEMPNSNNQTSSEFPKEELSAETVVETTEESSVTSIKSNGNHLSLESLRDESHNNASIKNSQLTSELVCCETRDSGIKDAADNNFSYFPEEALVNVIHEMEKELDKCRNRCEQLEKVVQHQQHDIDSLRFEIHWKDGRIEFLQTQLTQSDIPSTAP